MTANPSWLESPSPQTTPTQPSWLETPKPPQQPQWLQTPEPSQKQGPQPPYGINNPKGGIFGVNPGVNVMGDFMTNNGGFNTPGIRPEFRSIVTQLANDGNRMGVYDFNRGHHYAPNDPHLDGRAMDVDTVNGEPVGTRLSPNLGQFITQALSVDPRVRLGVPKQIYQQLGGLVGNGRIFVDDPAHIHVEFDPGAMYQHQQAAAVASPSPKWLAQTTPKPSAQPSPTASPLQQAQEASFGQVLQKAGSAVEEAGKGFAKEYVYEQDHPLALFSDTFGSLQRAVTGYLSKSDPTGKQWVTSPHDVLPAFGMAMYDAFHPHSGEVFDRDASAAIRSTFGSFNIPEAKHNTWAYYGQLIAAQTVTDPTTYIPLVGPLIHGAVAASTMFKIAEALDEVPALQGLIRAKQETLGKLADNAVTDGVKNLLGSRPELHDQLEDHAYAARIVQEHQGTKLFKPLHDVNEQEVEEDKDALENLQPNAVGQYLPTPKAMNAYNREAYVLGTPEMRAKVTQPPFNYKPTAEEAARPPLNLLDYNLRENYQTLIKPRQSIEDTAPRISGGNYKRPDPGFEKARTKDQDSLGNNQYEITKNRLRLGVNLARRRFVDNNTEEYLSKEGGWKPGVPHDVTNLSSKAWSVHWEPGSYMKKLANESIKAFPFPHEIGNVGPLQFLHGGWTAVGKAMKYWVTGLSQAQRDRLDSFGLLPEPMARDINSPWTKPPLSYIGGKAIDKGIEVSGKILNRMEGGFRQALLDLADHEHGFDPSNLRNEYGKAKAVFDALGDYENTSKIVKVISGIIGGPYVAFGLSVVPKSIWKAVREHPDKVIGMARAQTQLSSDKGGPLPPGTRLGGGPLESSSRLLTDEPSYIASPARTGLPGMGFTAINRLGARNPVDPAQIGGEMLQQYGGTVGNVMSGLFGLAYPGPGHTRGQPDLRDALFEWMTGKYIGKEPSAKAEEYFNQLEETGQYPKHFRKRHFQ